jgi:hypothetical protein
MRKRRSVRHYVCPCLGEVINGEFIPRPELLADPHRFVLDAIQDGLRHAAIDEAMRGRRRGHAHNQSRSALQ